MKKSWIRTKSSLDARAQRKGDSGHAGSADAPSPSHDEIARRAYELFVNRGCRQGQDQQDWLEAERELKDQTAKAAVPGPSELPVAMCAGQEESATACSDARPSMACGSNPVRRNAPPGRQDGREAKA